MLLLTTSSTAYVSIAGYVLVLLLRMTFTPLRLPMSKKVALGLIALISGTVLLALEVLVPAMSKLMLDILQQMTLNKLHSLSGIQRSFWVHKAWEAFWVSDWIGVGAGSLRSSGLISAIAGSMGIAGLISFVGALWLILKPMEKESHQAPVRNHRGLCAAFGWAAVLTLIPQLFAQPTPDPGLLFGIFAGISCSDMLSRRSRSLYCSDLQIAPNGPAYLTRGIDRAGSRTA
jgi:hypothetical protein